MPRTSFVLDDSTPLSGPRIDVNARIGWLMRSTRAATGLTLREMAEALGDHGIDVSPASVSRIESEGRRNDEVLEGYARVAGIPPYQLVVVVDDLCHSFSYGPSAPPATPITMEEYDARFEAVSAAHPTGDDWWLFATAHREGTGVGMPSALMHPHIDRVARELQRATTFARMLRWVCLVRLGQGRYSGSIQATLLGLALEPHGQRADDLIAILGEHSARGSLANLADLLAHESASLSRSASFSLQGALLAGGHPLEAWLEIMPALKAAWEATHSDQERRRIMSDLTRALPPQLRADLQPEARLHEASRDVPVVWTRDRHNPHYAFAMDLANTMTQERSLPADPLLARLLFEAMFEARGVRKAMSSWLLGASSYCGPLTSLLPRMWDRGPAGTRAAVARVSAFCQVEGDLPDLSALLRSENPEEFQHAMSYYATSSTPVPDEALAHGLAGDEATVRRTLYALGMAGDPRLDGLSADAGLPESVRGAARWWLDRGPRITK